ncbi:ArsR family transcriptional regulator [Nocardioides speluncae]|uniref:ArsR family transcriptional regulator n=1 Tax=Nocardioides speluncae TaxID=2670337 RepID=UPI001F0BBB5C|nr:ArsR family transcriptional regulator [Nocardioides speluncae]
MRSRAQGDVLAWIFLHPDAEHSIAEIARRVGVSEITALREVDRLAEADLVTESRQGRSRLVRPNDRNPATRPLTELLAVTFGPIPVLRQELAAIDGIDLAYIYGSWAERYDGTPGRTPGDIDVLVIGGADEDDLDRAASRAAKRVGREVNIQRVRPERWRTDTDSGFLQTVRNRPKVTLIGEGASA